MLMRSREGRREGGGKEGLRSPSGGRGEEIEIEIMKKKEGIKKLRREGDALFSPSLISK